MANGELEWKHISPPEIFEVTARVRSKIDNYIAFGQETGPDGQFHFSDERREKLSGDYDGMDPVEAERKAYRHEVEHWYITESLDKIRRRKGLEEYGDLVRSYNATDWISLDKITLTGLSLDFLDFVRNKGRYQPLISYLETLQDIGRQEEARKVVEEIEWPRKQPKVEDIVKVRVCPDCGKILQNWRGMRRHQGQMHKSIFDFLKTTGEVQ